LHGWVLDDYIFLNSLIFHELRYFSSGGKWCFEIIFAIRGRGGE
jgi:hypothetical protein